MMNALLWVFATLVTEWALKTIWNDVLRPELARRRERLDAEDRLDAEEFAAWHDAMIAEPAVTLERVWSVQDHLDDLAQRIAKLER